MIFFLNSFFLPVNKIDTFLSFIVIIKINNCNKIEMKMKKFGKLAGTITLVAVFAVQLFAADYKLDKSKSTVKWNGKKVTGQHYGTIDLKSGNLEVEDNKINSGTFQMNMASIVCEDLTDESTNKKLVGHLKSDDFFSVDKHPVATFVIKDVKAKSGKTHTFSGDLTIKGITHSVSFDAEVVVDDGHLRADGKMEVDRTLYDVRYGSGKFFQGLGDNLIYDTFSLDFNVVAFQSNGTAMLEPK